MKSEHRHELKTNDLAQSIMGFQDYARVYGGRVALGLVIVVLVIVLIMQRIHSTRDQAIKNKDDLAYARAQIDRLSHVAVLTDGRPTVQPGEGNVRTVLQTLREKASDKHVLAAAIIAQGDFDWAMANYPDVPAAATQPSLRPDKDRGELLKDAQAAYQEVLNTYGDQMLPSIAAHFGLAAIAENQMKWDDAKRQYEEVKTKADVPLEFKALAEDKLKRIDDIRQPLIIGDVPLKPEPPPAPPKAATLPTTLPISSAATRLTLPPSTAPAAATSKPAAK